MPNNNKNPDLLKEKEQKKPRIAIADDHDLFRQIFKLTLESAGMEVCCLASDGDQAIKVVQKHDHDLILLDIAMPEKDGLAALSIIKYLAPDTPVIIVSHMTDPVYMSRAMELGAEGFFSKGVTPIELISTIQAILSGESVNIDPAKGSEPPNPSVPGFAFPKNEPKELQADEFTPQEKLVLSLISMGNDNQVIMEKLHISKNTLKTHMRNIFSKINVKDRTQAAIWAIQNGYSLQPMEIEQV